MGTLEVLSWNHDFQVLMLRLQVSGNNVYSKLKYESGVHRVQRVPATESQGRVHTSTATVAVMPEVSRRFALDLV